MRIDWLSGVGIARLTAGGSNDLIGIPEDGTKMLSIERGIHEGTIRFKFQVEISSDTYEVPRENINY